MPDATETVIGMLAQYFPPAIARAVVRSTLRRGGFVNDSLDAVDLPDFVSALEQTLPMYIVDLERRGECVERVRELLPHAQRGPAPSPRPRPAPRENGRSLADRSPDSPRDQPDGSPASERLVGGSVRVRSSHDVVQACDLARETARKLEFSLLDQTKIATAASELARNILLYAGDGEVRILKVESPRGIQITAIDSGPGIADIDLVLNGGYRSRTGMGMGLKGAKRLMGELEIRTRLGAGTTVVATKVLR